MEGLCEGLPIMLLHGQKQLLLLHVIGGASVYLQPIKISEGRKREAIESSRNKEHLAGI